MKYIPWIIVIVAVAGLAFYQWRAASSTRALLQIKNNELQQANLELGRARTTITKQRELHKTAIKNIETKWQHEIKERKALITMYADLEARYKVEKNKVKIRTKIVYRDKPGEIIDLPKNKIYVREDNGEYREITSMEWNYKDHRITITGDSIRETLSYKLHQHFSGTLLETRLPGGAYNHYFRLNELDNKGKVIGKLKLDKFEVLKVDELPNKMTWWNPKIDLHVGFGINQRIDFNWVADLGVSLSTYGRTLDDIKWRFFRAGIGVTKHGLSISFSPAMYNIAKNLPLVSNMWISPFVGFDLGAKATHFGTGIGVVF